MTLVSESHLDTHNSPPEITVSCSHDAPPVITVSCSHNAPPVITAFRKSSLPFQKFCNSCETSRRSCFSSIDFAPLAWLHSFGTHFADTPHLAKHSVKMKCSKSMLTPTSFTSSRMAIRRFCLTNVRIWFGHDLVISACRVSTSTCSTLHSQYSTLHFPLMCGHLLSDFTTL